MNARFVPSNRLASLDVLRGFDLFRLVFFQPVFVAFARHWKDVPIFSSPLHQFEHVQWEGFIARDLVMPPRIRFLIGGLCFLPLALFYYMVDILFLFCN